MTRPVDRSRRRMSRDEAGALGLEFGIAVPILIALMLGIVQFGLVLGANGSMRDAMGEGLRLAKVDFDATEAEVTARTRAAFIGGKVSAIESLTFARSVDANGAKLGTMTMTYTVQPWIPFVPLDPIVMSETKTIYLPS